MGPHRFCAGNCARLRVSAIPKAALRRACRARSVIGDTATVQSVHLSIDDSVKRLKLYGIATDRILGLPDGSTVVLDRKQVEAMVALL
jgi:hypothetical protein